MRHKPPRLELQRSSIIMHRVHVRYVRIVPVVKLHKQTKLHKHTHVVTQEYTFGTDLQNTILHKHTC